MPDGRRAVAARQQIRSAHDDAGVLGEEEAQPPDAALEEGSRVDALVDEVPPQPVEQGVELRAAVLLPRPDVSAEDLLGEEVPGAAGRGRLQQKSGRAPV